MSAEPSRGRGRRCRVRTLLALAALLVGGCDAPEQSAQPEPAAARPPAPAERPLPPITLPDLSRLSPTAQQQLRDAHAAMLAADARNPPAARADRASARGELGKLLLAAGYRQPAEACFLHAEALAPDEARWPYYLGHVYYAGGDAAQASTAFQRAQQRRTADVPSLIWLARTHLDLGHPELAAPLFEQARALQPRAGAALLGLGQAAIARREYPQAITFLEDAMSVDPRAGEIRFALATAYQRGGYPDKADELRRTRGTEKVVLPDPLMEEVDALLETGVGYEIRGGRALERRDWATATDLFRKGIALAPDSPALRHKLGTALGMSGDAVGAVRQFEEVVRRWPDYAKGQYSLGVVLASNGRHQEAVVRFTAAARSDPADAQAHLQLAETQRVLSRFTDAVGPYERALALDPRLAPAHFGHAMALVGARRYRDALDGLNRATALFPGQGAFPHAAARLLAAAPEDGVRDGRRALTLLRSLGIERQWTAPLAETMAMALAETGRYAEAAKWQRDAIAEARKTGGGVLLPRMAGNLTLYEQRRPCRVPWGDELRIAAL
jgi:tetratricopeptide (TPR) repeat protein